jgi:hypothetical protein
MDGIRIVFGNPALRTLLLFGWLAGFYILPEGLAAAPTFVAALDPATRGRAFGVAQSGLCAPRRCYGLLLLPVLADERLEDRAAVVALLGKDRPRDEV